MSHATGDYRSSAAVKKATNDRGRRVQAKQAILHQLNVQLQSRSGRLESQCVDSAGDAEPTSSCHNNVHGPSYARFNHCVLCLPYVSLTQARKGWIQQFEKGGATFAFLSFPFLLVP